MISKSLSFSKYEAEKIFYISFLSSLGLQNVLECKSSRETVDLFLNLPQCFLSFFLFFLLFFFSVRVVIYLETMRGHLVTDLMIKLSNTFFSTIY